MLLAASGLSCFLVPQADGVGEPMPAAPRKVQQIAGRNACNAKTTMVLAVAYFLGHAPGRTAGGAQNRHQCGSQKLAVRADIPWG